MWAECVAKRREEAANDRADRQLPILTTRWRKTICCGSTGPLAPLGSNSWAHYSTHVLPNLHTQSLRIKTWLPVSEWLLWANAAGKEISHSPVRSRTRGPGAASHISVIPVTWTLGRLGSKAMVNMTMLFTPLHIKQRTICVFMTRVAEDVGATHFCRYFCIT